MYYLMSRLRLDEFGNTLAGLQLIDESSTIHYILASDARYLAYTGQIFGAGYTSRTNSINYSSGKGKGRAPSTRKITREEAMLIPWEPIQRNPDYNLTMNAGRPKVVGLVIDTKTDRVCGIQIEYPKLNLHRTVTIEEAVSLSEQKFGSLPLSWIAPVRTVQNNPELLRLAGSILRQSGVPSESDFCRANVLDERIDSRVANILYPGNVKYVNYDFGVKFLTAEESKLVMRKIEDTYREHVKDSESSEVFIPVNSTMHMICEIFNVTNHPKAMKKGKPKGFIVSIAEHTLCIDNETMRKFINLFGMPTFEKNDYRYIIIKDMPYNIERRQTSEGYILTLYR